MLTSIRAAAALAALALAAPTLAQQQASHPRVGLGISMNTSLLAPLTNVSSTGAVFSPPTLLYVPFYVAPNVRIEPAIGWTKVNNDQDDLTSSSLQLGIGAVILKPVTASTNLYAGARLSSIWDRDETRVSPTVVRKDTQRNTDLALVIGGEYLPTPWFSVGAEGQLDFAWTGDVTHDQGGVRTTTAGGNVYSTQALFFIRVYFL